MKTLIPCVLALLMAGCALPGRQHAALAQTDPAQFTAGWQAGDTVVDDHWWQAYGDAQLDALVQRAVAGNPNIENYEARIHSAEATAQAAGAVLRPGLTLAGEAPYQRTSKNSIIPPPYSGRWEWQPSLNLSLDFALDFWGGNRAALQAAISSIQAARFEAEDVRLQLVAAVVTLYTQLDHAYAQRDFAESIVAERKAQLAINQQRYQAGLDSQLETRQAEANLAQATAERAGWDEQIDLTGQQMAVLLGQGPDFGKTIQRPSLRAPRFGLPSNLPAELLGRRPDIAAARARVAASLSSVQAARAAFYPNVNLSAFVGLTSYGLDKFAQAGSLQAGVKPAFTLPILDSQRLRAGLAGRGAERDAAIAAYNGALVEALHQVAEPLTQLQTIDSQRPALAAASAAAEHALTLARLRYQQGLSTQLPVLAAESAWITARRAESDLDAKALSASAALAKAVGGGWSPAEQPSASPR